MELLGRQLQEWTAPLKTHGGCLQLSSWSPEVQLDKALTLSVNNFNIPGGVRMDNVLGMETIMPFGIFSM